MTGRNHHRRQGRRRGAAPRGGRRGGSAETGARPDAGARRRARGRGPGEPGLRAHQGQGDARGGHAAFEHKLPADTPEAALLALIGGLNDDPDVHGILVQLPLPGTSTRQGHRGDRPGQGRGRLPSRQRRPAGRRAPRRWRRDADRLPDAGQVGGAGSGAGGGGHRALQHRRQAGGQLLLGENCTVTIAHSRTRDLPAVCAGPTSWWRPSAGPRWCGATGSSPAPSSSTSASTRDRRGRQEQAGRRRGVRERAGGGRHHAGAGRRRADDDRLPAAEHARGGEARCAQPS